VTIRVSLDGAGLAALWAVQVVVGISESEDSGWADTRITVNGLGG
jgi:hypothetical protein